MALFFYKDAELTSRISEGDLSNPDSDVYDGLNGDSKDAQIYVANEQVLLDGDIDESTSNISLQTAGFADGEIIIIDSEQMRIVSGGGTTSLVVTRAYGGTTGASHLDGASVISGFNYQGIVVDPVDVVDTDESDWYKLALTQGGLDAAVGGASLNLSDKNYDAVTSFWRRCTVPAETPVQNKVDIKLHVTATEVPIL